MSLSSTQRLPTNKRRKASCRFHEARRIRFRNQTSALILLRPCTYTCREVLQPDFPRNIFLRFSALCEVHCSITQRPANLIFCRISKFWKLIHLWSTADNFLRGCANSVSEQDKEKGKEESKKTGASLIPTVPYQVKLVCPPRNLARLTIASQCLSENNSEVRLSSHEDLRDSSVRTLEITAHKGCQRGTLPSGAR